ncbi:polymeric immunoglobulin receptor-like isoform X2 [Cheilinus undulatus]|uniref:polymeric immunoglobulin receptor-like isoform X2 n=1 Tax=Cheilinus undulatus TaxID=241271 RepID=UPI001BD3EEBE|nr:polymeric immunoglobulin receptor-like isoform X2 [Cheilinus undulatus]
MKMVCFQSMMFILCIALSWVFSAAGPIQVSGYEGQAVNISCSYSQGYESYEKYLCRKECSNNDVLVTTTGTQRNRYIISDDTGRRVFTATISDLGLTDAGTYWCGVTRIGKDIYTEIRLEVGPDICCKNSTRLQSYEDSSVSFSCPYEQSDQDNLKYMCRGRQASTCLQQALITSDTNQKGRFSLTDDKVTRKFTVTITSLTVEDSGSYLCGVQRNSTLDVFTAADLEVKEWCCVKSSELSGIVGRPVTIQCPYPLQHRDNRKFLCKGDDRKTCRDMMSQSRFSLQDDVSSSSFSVMIAELKAEDAGMYWCGSDPQWRVGNYTKVQLSVDFSTTTEVNPAGSETTSVPDRLVKDVAKVLSLGVIVSIVVVLALVILTFSVIMIHKYKCCRAPGAEVSVKRNQRKAAGAQEVICEADMYENLGAAAASKQMTLNLDNDDSLYQNFSTEEIYCNQMYIKSKR